MRDFQKKDSEERKQSGVEVEYGEVDQCYRISEKEEMRRQATEKLSETKKRKASEEDPDDDKISPAKKEKLCKYGRCC